MSISSPNKTALPNKGLKCNLSSTDNRRVKTFCTYTDAAVSLSDTLQKLFKILVANNLKKNS